MFWTHVYLVHKGNLVLPALRRESWVDLCEFKACLLYRASCRTARATQSNLSQKTKGGKGRKRRERERERERGGGERRKRRRRRRYIILCLIIMVENLSTVAHVYSSSP